MACVSTPIGRVGGPVARVLRGGPRRVSYEKEKDVEKLGLFAVRGNGKNVHHEITVATEAHLFCVWQMGSNPPPQTASRSS